MKGPKDWKSQMVRRAQGSARKAGLENVEFRHAPIERLPLDDCIWLIARKGWTGRAAEA